MAALITVSSLMLSDVTGFNAARSDSGSLFGNYLSGRFAWNQRDTVDAADYYDKALEQDPGNKAILKQTFLLNTAAGNWDQAVALARKLVDDEKNDRIVRYLLAVKAFKDKKYDEAETHFAASRKGPIFDLTTELARAWLLLAQGKQADALNMLSKKKKAEWSQYYQQYHKGLIADLAGQKAVARKAFAAAFEKSPRTMRVADAYARHAAAAGDTKLARQIVKTHLQKAGNPQESRALLHEVADGGSPGLLIDTPDKGIAEIFFGIGEALTSEGGVELGTIYLQLALYLTPDFPLAHRALGDVYSNANKYEPALAAYDRVPRSSPLWLNVQIRKAFDLNAMDKHDEATALLEKVIAEFPQSSRPLESMGRILRAQKQYERAAHYYSRAIALVDKPEKQHWRLFYARGVCFERMKQWPKAEADLQTALKLNPDEPLVLNYLGYSWVDQGVHLKEAMALIRKAVKLKPDDGYFVDSLGWVHYRLGQYKEAVEHLERAAELKPDDPVINDHLGDAYWHMNRHLESKYQWSQALILKPEPEDEETIRKKLETGLVAPGKVVAAASGNAEESSDAAKTRSVGTQPAVKPEEASETPEAEKNRKEDVAVLGTQPAEVKKAAEDAAKPRYHVVKNGESLWDIANKHYGDGFLFGVIYRANKAAIKDPDRIFKGQRLLVPPKP